MTHTEIKEKYQKATGKSISNNAWQYLERQDFFSSVIEDEEISKGSGIRALIKTVKELEWFFGNSAHIHLKKEIEEIEIPPDKRFEAFSQIMAILSNKNEAVLKFREEVLKNKLLKPEEVPQWIEQQAATEQSSVTISLTMPRDCFNGKDWGIRFLNEAKRFVDTKEAGGYYPYKYDFGVIHYLNPEYYPFHPMSINESKNSVLGRLKNLAKLFSKIWREEKAVQFILTGQEPKISPVKTFLQRGKIPRITLELSPHLKPEEVSKIYSKVKKRYADSSGQQRRLSEKSLALAIFRAEEEGSWSQLLQKWNDKYANIYPKPYKDKANFARECKAAFKRLTNSEWYPEIEAFREPYIQWENFSLTIPKGFSIQDKIKRSSD